MQPHSTQRFSDRVNNYVKYRPGYPSEAIDYLISECCLEKNAGIADIGAGTGIFSRLLLDKGFRVYAVEPNQPMLDEAINALSRMENFVPVNGAAESTGLADQQVDCIVCAQAFHWFNNNLTKKEFIRILKPGGKVALVWNNRLIAKDEFSQAYDRLLLDQSIDYSKVNHQKLTAGDFRHFYKKGLYTMKSFPNQQIFDEEGLIGRAQSSSYVPQPGTKKGQLFLAALKQLFSKYNVQGKVGFYYETEIYIGEV